jgi:hypothetical protein
VESEWGAWVLRGWCLILYWAGAVLNSLQGPSPHRWCSSGRTWGFTAFPCAYGFYSYLLMDESYALLHPVKFIVIGSLKI